MALHRDLVWLLIITLYNVIQKFTPPPKYEHTTTQQACKILIKNSLPLRTDFRIP